jgi:hypothetical protein
MPHCTQQHIDALAHEPTWLACILAYAIATHCRAVLLFPLLLPKVAHCVALLFTQVQHPGVTPTGLPVAHHW